MKISKFSFILAFTFIFTSITFANVGSGGAGAGSSGGSSGQNCDKTGPPKCPSQTLKISREMCINEGSKGDSEALKQMIKSFTENHDKKYDKEVKIIHTDNKRNPACSIRVSTRIDHNQSKCETDVLSGYIEDCSNASSTGIIPLKSFAFHNNSLTAKIKNFFFMPTVAAQNHVVLTNRNFSQTYRKAKNIVAKRGRLRSAQLKAVVDQNSHGKRLALQRTNIEQHLNDLKNIRQPLQQEQSNLLQHLNGTKTANIKNPMTCKPPKCNQQPETFKNKNFTNFIIPPSSGGGGSGTCISNEHSILKPKTTIANGEIIKINTETEIVSFDLINKESCSIELENLEVFLPGSQITSSEKIKLILYYKINNQEKEVDEIEILPQDQDKKFDLKKLILPPNTEIKFNISINAPQKFKNKNFYLEVKASKNIDIWDGEIAQTKPYSIRSSNFIIQE